LASRLSLILRLLIQIPKSTQPVTAGQKTILIFACFFVGTARSQFRSDNCGCAIPQGDTTLGDGRRLPTADMMQQLSPDGKKLLYLVDQGDAGAHILDLKSLEDKVIIVHGGLPGEQDFGESGLSWCPYDPDLLALVVTSFIDTNNSGQSTVYVNNLFTYRISTGESQLVTPQVLKPYGPATLSLYSWTAGSKRNSDTLLIGFKITESNSDSGFYGLFIPESQSLISVVIPRNGNDTTILAISHDGHQIWGIDTTFGPHKIRYLLDSSIIVGPRRIQTLWHASFSPNAKLVALTVDPAGTGGGGLPLYDNNWDTVFQQVWIFSSDNPHPDSSQMKIINFQCLFCTYNFHGAWAEFLTDSTIAVSMHHDGDTNSWLWDITIDGRIVRQLTGVQQNNVVVYESQPSPFTIHPTPASGRITVSMPGLSVSAKFSITDAVGRTVISRDVPAGSGTFEIETAQLPDGVYFCQLVSAAEMWSEKLVVRH